MVSQNPMNCHNCDYMAINDDKTLHCYMFKNEPTSFCAQFRPKHKHRLQSNFEEIFKKTISEWMNVHAKI